MKSNSYTLLRYDADEGKVFDWANLSEHTIEETNEDGEVTITQEHLYAKTVFLGSTDSIDNYVEVEEPTTEE